jgi:hypothetical protein
MILCLKTRGKVVGIIVVSELEQGINNKRQLLGLKAQGAFHALLTNVDRPELDQKG